MSELEKARAYNEGLLKSMVDGLGVLDLGGKVIDVNAPLLGMVGLKREEIVGLPLLQSFGPMAEPEEIEKISGMLGQLMAGVPVGSTELVFTAKDGTQVTLSVAPSLVRDAKGKPIMVFATMRDVTERKRIEQEIQEKNEQLNAQNEELRATGEELRASNEELQTTIDELGEANVYNEGLLKSMVDGLGVLDLEGKVIDVNAPLLVMLRLKREEIVGLPLVQSLGPMTEPEEIEKISGMLGQLMAGVPVGSTELVFTAKDGTQVTLSVAPSLVRDAKGKPMMLFAVMRDITERKRMEQEIQEKNEQLDAQNEELRTSNEELRATEEELRTSNEELETANEELREAQEQLIRSEKLAAIGQLAGGVGHELRNPLGAIKNAVYYVKGKVAKSELPQKEPRILEFLEIMDEEVNSSNKIINDLLGFSRVGKPAVSPTQVKKVIADALARVPVPENIVLTKQLDADSTEIEIDSDQIHQVLVNIITNALQAMPEGGKLTLGAREKGKYLEVEISDTGVGIPPEVKDKIFEPLFTTRAKGIGLGLAVCKSIIDRHNGQIEVKSKVGEGTTFSIKLPLKAA